jgi:hypothetical protein
MTRLALVRRAAALALAFGPPLAFTACGCSAPANPTVVDLSSLVVEDPPELPRRLPPDQVGEVGFVFTDLTAEEANKARVSGGVTVVAVYPDSPAARGGLVAGDVITAVDGQPITCGVIYAATFVGKNRVGEQMSFTVRGKAGTRDVPLTFVSEPPAWADHDRAQADKGEAWAKRNLALRHLNGAGVRQDSAYAAVLLQPLASAGDRDALALYGELLLYGRGVPRDPYGGFSRLLSAAKKGHPRAQAIASACYCLGNGTSKQPDQAAHWARLSAEAGDPQGWVQLAIDALGDAQARPRNPALALDLGRKAAKAGHPGGYFLVGEMYRLGDGVPKSRPTAGNRRAILGLPHFR